ncbi:MAG TPA: hypothetical protein VKQ30_20735 [Ktedonobacterales bacterium]|nr:hypothetical protein [Ktedonobacterales bacterium]
MQSKTLEGPLWWKTRYVVRCPVCGRKGAFCTNDGKRGYAHRARVALAMLLPDGVTP